jgi:hypothetical protein
MIRNTAKTVLARFGYEVRRRNTSFREERGYRLYSYFKEDGSFDYDRYRATQIEGNKHKIEGVWVLEENIAFLSKYIQDLLGTPRFGLCHGTRRGKEQEWFRKYLECEVIGTEISDTATQFPHTIQWDFHETQPDWIDATDFIYSNSFDHSYDPERCLNAWMSCVRPGGVCILEHTASHTPAKTSQLDPFGADLTMMPFLVLTWGKGRYSVRELLTAPATRDRLRYIHFLVIQRS